MIITCSNQPSIITYSQESYEKKSSQKEKEPRKTKIYFHREL